MTEDAGRYLEIQAGLGKTQYGCIPMAPQTAWEWMEQYGPVQIPVEDMGKSHKERSGNLSLRIREAKIREKMTDTLKATKTMAKQPAELVIAGSGYGAMAKRGPWTGHLEFRLESESLKKWAEFFNGAALHMPDADVAPDEFFIDEDNLEFMENALKENEENWYAHYHLGLGYYAKGDFEKAEAELKKSYEFKKNAWACHALACVCLRKGRKAEGTDYMVEGINMQKTEVSYLKDGFKILTLCGAYEKLCICYENLETEIQKVGKLRFYYISALYELGFDEKAYELLEADGGLMMDDIREGENSISKLWTELRKNLYGEAGQIPHKYNFEAV